MNKEKNVITYKHINGEMWCSIPGFPNHYANKNGYMYRKITRNLHKGECYKVNRLTKEQVIYIYTCSKTIKQLSKELNIKETTIRAIRKQQNHYKTTKNLTKGEW